MGKSQNTRLNIAKVEAVIESKGLRKKWIAERMALHPTTFYGYLNGSRTPSRSMIQLLAYVLDVSEDEIAA